MKPHAFSQAFVLFVAMGLAASVLAQPKPEGESRPAASNTANSSRSVLITWGDDATAPDLNRVFARLFSVQHAGEIAQETIGLKPDVGRIYASRTPKLALADHSATTTLQVYLDPKVPGVRLASKEFADALVERLSALLADDRMEQTARRRELARVSVDRLERELLDREKQIREHRAEFRAASGRADVSPQNIQAALAKLEDERQKLELELAGMEARMRAVEEQIERVTATSAKSANEDPVVGELKKAVDTRERLLAVTRQRFEAGQVASAEVSTAEVALVDAKVQLLDRQASAAARVGDAAAPLNRELQGLAIDVRDREARLQHVKKRLDPLRAGSERLVEMETLEAQSASARRALEQAMERLREAERQMDDAPIDRVIVVDSGDAPPVAE